MATELGSSYFSNCYVLSHLTTDWNTNYVKNSFKVKALALFPSNSTYFVTVK